MPYGSVECSCSEGGHVLGALIQTHPDSSVSLTARSGAHASPARRRGLTGGLQALHCLGSLPAGRAVLPVGPSGPPPTSCRQVKSWSLEMPRAVSGLPGLPVPAALMGSGLINPQPGGPQPPTAFPPCHLWGSPPSPQMATVPQSPALPRAQPTWGKPSLFARARPPCVRTHDPVKLQRLRCAARW